MQGLQSLNFLSLLCVGLVESQGALLYHTGLPTKHETVKRTENPQNIIIPSLD